VSYEIGVAVSVLVKRLEPVEITFTISVDERILPSERRVADDRIEAASGIPFRISREDFRELDLPVKWLKPIVA
jgi:hypothetical protein